MRREYKGTNKTENILLPEVIDYRLTNLCNMHCPFCFGTKISESINYEQLYSFFKSMKETGVNKVVLTGGEPTMSPNFIYVVKMLKSLGLRLFLSSNGSFWNDLKKRMFVLENFECVALPLEVSENDLHNSIRLGAFNHYALVIEILKSIHKISSIKIKLETVVSKKNYKHIEKMLDILPIRPDMWKLYQMCKTPDNIEYYHNYKVTDEEFAALIERIKDNYKNSTIKISTLYEYDRNERHLFLEPDGSLMIITNGSEKIIGNYKENIDALTKKISNCLNVERVNNNFCHSFITD